MTENKRFEMKDPNCWGYPITDNKTGTVYNCNSNIWMKELVGVLNALDEENTRLLKANMELTEENTTTLSTIRQAYQTERTTLGRNVLKQLLKQLE